MNRDLVWGLLVGLCLAGCVSMSFPYNYYGLNAVSYQGTLLGKTVAQDVDLASTCTPDDKIKLKCVVMKVGDFYQMQSDFLTGQQALIDCQAGK